MYKIFATAEEASKYSYKTSGFLNGHDCVVKVDAGYILVPVSTYSGWMDYNAIIAE